MPESNGSNIQNILLESRYLELKDKSMSAAIGSFALVLVFQFVIFGNAYTHFYNLCIVGLLLGLTTLRIFHSKMDSLKAKTWLSTFSIISGSTALAWGFLLNNSVLVFSEKPEVAALSYIVYGGLFSAAAYSLSISKFDFFVFQGILLGSFLTSVFLQPRFYDLRIGSIFVAIIFLLFMSRQRKIWSTFWQKQQIANHELQKILDSFPGGITIFEHGKYKKVNKHVSDALGLPDREIIGKEVGFLNPNSEIAKFIQSYLSKISTTTPRLQKEIVVTTPTGPRTQLVLIESLVQGTASKEIIVISVDIHDQKLAQAEIEKQRGTLEHSAKMAALGEMSSGLAHEINNPLAVISARAQQILNVLKKPEPPDLEKLKSGVEAIKSTTFRIAKIIKGLRTFARDVESDPFELGNLKEILSETLTFCEARFRSHDIEIDTSSVAEDLLFDCKPTQISQVLLNALNNSHDAIEKNEGPKWIRVESKKENESLVIFITDSGNGIPLHAREKLMQPFFTTKEIGKGTGLGLSLSKGLIEMHGGTFAFNFDHPNTQLVIRLPIKQIVTQKVA